MVIEEKRSHIDVPFGFLTLIFLLAAWRGWSGARAMAIAFAVGAVVTAVAWVIVRRKPLSQLEITHGSITWSRAGGTICYMRHASPRVELRSRVDIHAVRGWSLTRPEVAADPAISLDGFDVFELRNVLEQHGWTVSE